MLTKKYLVSTVDKLKDKKVAKDVRLWFSHEHTSKSNNGKQHVDGYRSVNGRKDKGYKTHNDYPGKQNVNIRRK